MAAEAGKRTVSADFSDISRSKNNSPGNPAEQKYEYLPPRKRMEIVANLYEIAKKTPVNQPCFLGTLDLPTKWIEPIAYAIEKELRRLKRKFFVLINDYWPEGGTPSEQDISYVYMYDPEAMLFDVILAASYITELTLCDDGYTFRICQQDTGKLKKDIEKAYKGEKKEDWAPSIGYDYMIRLIRASLQNEKWPEETSDAKGDVSSTGLSRSDAEMKIRKDNKEFARNLRAMMVKEDFDYLFLHYRSEAEKEKAWSFRALGRCYLQGLGTCINEEKAYRYFDEAVRRGDPKAWRCLAYCYGAGVGVSQNLIEMQTCLENGADAGDDEAQRVLGAWYMSSNSEKDCEQAEKWLQKAANQGNEEAKELYHVMHPVMEFMRDDERVS